MKEVQMIEIYEYCSEDDKEAVAFDWSSKKNLKMICCLINGIPYILNDGLMLKKKVLTEKQAQNLIAKYRK